MGRLKTNDPCWCGSKKKFKRCHAEYPQRLGPVRPGVISPTRTVPADIARPPYLETGGVPRGGATVQIMEGTRLDAMREASRIAAEVLIETGAAVAPGVSTDELDAIAHEAYIKRGAFPSTLGYRGYRKSICTSVNEVVCHGIPDSRVLAAGDIVNVDVTAYIGGVHGDTSATFAVGAIDPATEALVKTTCEATYRGIAAIAPGRQLREIGRAIEPFAESRGLGVVRDYGGHGIGEVFHGAPHVHHMDDRSATFVFAPGMTFTVEPMLNGGTHRHHQWDDDWTVVTDDLLPSAQFEHTVVVTESGVEILTVTADGETAVAWPNRVPAAAAL